MLALNGLNVFSLVHLGWYFLLLLSQGMGILQDDLQGQNSCKLVFFIKQIENFYFHKRFFVPKWNIFLTAKKTWHRRRELPLKCKKGRCHVQLRLAIPQSPISSSGKQASNAWWLMQLGIILSVRLDNNSST